MCIAKFILRSLQLLHAQIAHVGGRAAERNLTGRTHDHDKKKKKRHMFGLLGKKNLKNANISATQNCAHLMYLSTVECCIFSTSEGCGFLHMSSGTGLKLGTEVDHNTDSRFLLWRHVFWGCVRSTEQYSDTLVMP